MNFSQEPVEILLADDDPDDRALFQEALAEAKKTAKLTALEDGQKLMDFLAEIELPPPPNIIFLDINMPIKTGTECLLAIRKNPKFDNVPVIMFTTSSHRQDIEESYRAGANMFISKSFFFENDVNILIKLFSINWKEYIPQPSMEKFVLAYNF